MQEMIEGLDSDVERAQYLQNLLISQATGGPADGEVYQNLRRHFIDNPDTKLLLPAFVRANRDLSQFWQFIKFKLPTYAKRQEFIWAEFGPLFDHLERRAAAPADASISEGLKNFDQNGVHGVWTRALERRKSDPEGAITAARTLLEAVCKHILDARGIEYDPSKAELHELYRLTAKELNLSPSQHTEEVFKKVLGGCSAIVSGLGTLRNRLGDAHGKGKQAARPASRHAELAVNIAGSVALFLVATWEAQIVEEFQQD